MSRADEIRAREAQRTERRAAAAEDRPHHSSAPRVRAKAVRKTVDLPPARYAALTEWCSETALQLGVARVTGQDVFNALVARLLTDETLARRIRADLDADLRR